MMQSRVTFSKQRREQAKVEKRVLVAAKFDWKYADGDSAGTVIEFEGLYTPDEARKLAKAFMEREWALDDAEREKKGA